MAYKRSSIFAILVLAAGGAFAFAQNETPPTNAAKEKNPTAEATASPATISPGAVESLYSHTVELKKADGKLVAELLKQLGLAKDAEFDEKTNTLSLIIAYRGNGYVNGDAKARSLGNAKAQSLIDLIEELSPVKAPGRAPVEIQIAAELQHASPEDIAHILEQSGLVNRAIAFNDKNSVVYTVRLSEKNNAIALIKALDKPNAIGARVGAVEAPIRGAEKVLGQPSPVIVSETSKFQYALRNANASDVAERLKPTGLALAIEIQGNILNCQIRTKDRDKVEAFIQALDKPTPAETFGGQPVERLAGNEIVPFRYTFSNANAKDVAGIPGLASFAQTMTIEGDNTLVFRMRAEERHNLNLFLAGIDATWKSLGKSDTEQVIRVIKLGNVPFPTLEKVLDQSGLRRLLVVDTASNTVIATGSQSVVDRIQKIVTDLEAHWPVAVSAPTFPYSTPTTPTAQMVVSPSSAIADVYRKAKENGQTDKATAMRQRMQGSVRSEFDERQKKEAAEVVQLRERLQKVEQRLETRAKAKEQIIDRRVQELLEPELDWSAGAAAPASEPGLPSVRQARIVGERTRLEPSADNSTSVDPFDAGGLKPGESGKAMSLSPTFAAPKNEADVPKFPEAEALPAAKASEPAETSALSPYTPEAEKPRFQPTPP